MSDIDTVLDSMGILYNRWQIDNRTSYSFTETQLGNLLATHNTEKEAQWHAGYTAGELTATIITDGMVEAAADVIYDRLVHGAYEGFNSLARSALKAALVDSNKSSERDVPWRDDPCANDEHELRSENGFNFCGRCGHSLTHEGKDAIAKLEAEVTQLKETNKQLTSYVQDAAGNESCLIPIATLTAITQRAEKAEAELKKLRGQLEFWNRSWGHVEAAALEVIEAHQSIMDTTNEQRVSKAIKRLKAELEALE